MSKNSGCGGGVVVIFLIFVALAIAGLAVYSVAVDSETSRLNAESRLVAEQARARSIILEAQGQARLDSALASQMLSSAALPWGVILVLGLLGLAVVVLVGYLASRASRPGPHQQVPQVIYLAHPGWVLLPDQPIGGPVLVAGREKITTHKSD